MKPWNLFLILSLSLMACRSSGGLGDSCDAPDECDEGLVCDSTRGMCLGGANYACSTSSDKPQCETGRTCVGDDETGRCSLLQGDVCNPDDSQCPDDLVCDATAGAENRCYPPVVLVGTVSSTADGAAIEGAHVIALNEERMPVTDVAVTNAAGEYSLAIPVVRSASGAPESARYTLRVSAADYLTFPKGIRPALPIDATIAEKGDDAWVIQSSLTAVQLIPLETQGLARISGTVNAGAASGGVLVVAEVLETTGEVVVGSGHSALSDLGGAFTIFNVPEGDYTLRGYRADVQLAPTEVSVTGTTDETDVVLSASDAPLSEVSGGIINNSPDYSHTSVVFIPKSVFDDVYIRGEVPPGLRAPRFGDPNVTTAFTVSGVPNGEYVVLAAFENDGLVRDESGGGNTEIVETIIPHPEHGHTFTLSSQFKVRSALPVVSPGSGLPEAVPDGVDTTFDLTWGRWANAKRYDVVVINALGEPVWALLDIPQPGGNQDITVTYEGPALQPGMYYQFKAEAWSETGTAGNLLSRTEDLRGVFYHLP